jgi:hypothetical protein
MGAVVTVLGGRFLTFPSYAESGSSFCCYGVGLQLIPKASLPLLIPDDKKALAG